MNLSFALQSLCDIICQTGRGFHFSPTHGGRAFCHLGLRPHPNDIINAVIVAKEQASVLVDVHQSSDARKVYSEVIQKVTILTKTETIVGVIHRAIFVAQKQHDART